ncbi:recombinase family protein [Sedimentibacter sp.]|uniref:recombinase family protein n=1 Tax=Sedimentibacter sp. TaxID=1960295 RepID=UPI00289FA669|nr:recombinase family protein [Sedimentibacter sp.]
MQALRKKNISIIPSNPAYDKTIKVQFKALRVAAYCRVSTLLEQQEGSYEAQVSYYTEKIQQNPNWKLAGIYADDGKSATNTKKRDDFNALIEDCMAGKIDLVLTKSVSRFARNTVDSLQAIRKLREKNIGIIFEKEGINTLEGSGELLITILSSQAQEESRNLSENTRWGFERKFEKGVVMVNHKKFLGYTKDEYGELVIVPEQAQLVRRIYRLYLEGLSTQQIADTFMAEGIKTVTGNDKWHDTVIAKILQNEKYMGDVLQQKTYTIDFLTKKRVKNDGIVPQYYIEDNHEAIVPKEIFFQVQEERARRASLHKPAVTRRANKEKSKYSSKYVLSDILVCGECKHPYRRQTWSRNGVITPVWRCESRLASGTKNCKHSPTLKEKPLHEAIMTAVNNVVENHREVVGAFRQNIIRIVGSYSTKNMESEFDEQIDMLQGQLLELIEENAKQGAVDEDFDERYKKIADEMQELKMKKLKQARERKLAGEYGQRMDGMDSCLGVANYDIRMFDEDLIRRLVLRIRVISEEKIEIHFKAGFVMLQDVPLYE